MGGAALCAVVFRVNLPLALLTTLYTNPFTIVPLYLLAYQIGRMAIGDTAGFVAPPDVEITRFVQWTQAMQDWMLSVATPLGVGVVLLAATLSVTGYFLTKAVWRIWLIRAWHRRRDR
jgi:uncharacterized protein (DUF2062 family)